MIRLNKLNTAPTVSWKYNNNKLSTKSFRRNKLDLGRKFRNPSLVEIPRTNKFALNFKFKSEYNKINQSTKSVRILPLF